MKLTRQSTLKPLKQNNMFQETSITDCSWQNMCKKIGPFLSPGIVHFSQVIRMLEREDPEVAHLHAQVRAHFLPPVSISTEPSA
jgi:hypothetical protein